MKEDTTGNFDNCVSGTPENIPPEMNVGYRKRKEQFAAQVPIKNSEGETTGDEVTCKVSNPKNPKIIYT